MIKRIVKMTFRAEEVDNFMIIFNESHPFIQQMPGCYGVELYRDETTPNILFTLSVWDSVESLDNYRQSELFRNVWSKTKQLFSDKPNAWSITKIQ